MIHERINRFSCNALSLICLASIGCQPVYHGHRSHVESEEEDTTLAATKVEMPNKESSLAITKAPSRPTKLKVEQPCLTRLPTRWEPRNQNGSLATKPSEKQHMPSKTKEDTKAVPTVANQVVKQTTKVNPVVKEVDLELKTKPAVTQQPEAVPSQIAKILAPSKTEAEPKKVTVDEFTNAQPESSVIAASEETDKSKETEKTAGLPKTPSRLSFVNKNPQVAIESKKIAPVVDNLLNASYTAESIPKSISQMLEPLAEKAESEKELIARTANALSHPQSSRRRYQQNSKTH